MTTYVLCLSDDLRNDVALYALEKHANILRPADLAGGRLDRLGAGDWLIIYSHGQYRQGPAGFVATNRIFWFDEVLSGSETALKLIDADFPVGTENLTILVHACFTAGTVEAPPSAAEVAQTFAGQLCASLKAYYLPGLRVIGYQGASKAGKAGFAANARENAKRLRRGEADPNHGDLFSVIFGGEGDRDALLQQGDSVRWS